MAKKAKQVVPVEVPAIAISAVAQLLTGLEPKLKQQRRIANLKAAAYRFIKDKQQADEELQLIKNEQKIEAEKLQTVVKEMSELHGFITSGLRERVNHDPAVKQAKQILAKDNDAFVKFMAGLQAAIAADARREEALKQQPLLAVANLAKAHLDELHQQYRITVDFKAEMAKKADLCFKKAEQIAKG